MLCPEFINHILTVWVPYMPFWTAVDLILINKKLSRLSNAYIEATHKVNKDYVVKKTKNTLLGDVVRLVAHRRKDVLSIMHFRFKFRVLQRN